MSEPTDLPERLRAQVLPPRLARSMLARLARDAALDALDTSDGAT